jgi:CobW/HypB/UreG, nucleotide-binding domain
VRHCAHHQRQQIEFADVILLNKTDLVSLQQTKQLQCLLKKLNSSAEIICTTHSNVPLHRILNTGLFSMEKVCTCCIGITQCSSHSDRCYDTSSSASESCSSCSTVIAINYSACVTLILSSTYTSFKKTSSCYCLFSSLCYYAITYAIITSSTYAVLVQYYLHLHCYFCYTVYTANTCVHRQHRRQVG